MKREKRRNMDKEKIKELVDRAYFDSGLSDEDFSEFMRQVLYTYPISDTCEKEFMNSRIVLDLADKIWKHNILWKLFMY